MWMTNKDHEEQKRIAKKAAEEYHKKNKGKKIVRIPHPTIPRTWIEKFID